MSRQMIGDVSSKSDLIAIRVEVHCNVCENGFESELELLEADNGLEARGPSPRICHAQKDVQP